MTGEAWTFAGIAVTAMLGLLGTIVIQHYTTKRDLAALGVTTRESRDNAQDAASSAKTAALAADAAEQATRPIGNGTIPSIVRQLNRIEQNQRFEAERTGRTVARLDGALDEIRELRRQTTGEIRELHLIFSNHLTHEHDRPHVRRAYRDALDRHMPEGSVTDAQASAEA